MATVAADRQTVRARAKWVHTSPRKARLVIDLIRGRSVPEARTILAFSQRAAARDVEKVLRSAVANAESRPDLLWRGDDLLVAAAYVDEGPTQKRWRARARGRVARIRKRTCHITIELVQSPEAIAAAEEAATRPRRRLGRAVEAAPAAETPGAETAATGETAEAQAVTAEEPSAAAEEQAAAEEPTKTGDEPTEESEE